MRRSTSKESSENVHRGNSEAVSKESSVVLGRNSDPVQKGVSDVSGDTRDTRSAPAFRRSGSIRSISSQSSWDGDLGEDWGLRQRESFFHSTGSFEALFQRKAKLGSGASGTVWSVKKQGTKEVYAAKTFRDASDLASLDAQLKLISRVRHPHVVQMLGVIHDGPQVHLIMELSRGENLERIISTRSTMSRGGLPRKMAAACMWQMLSSCAYLHHWSIAHRDIKPRHFLVEAKDDGVDTVKLLDFGSAVAFKRGRLMTGTVGTPFFRSPEMLDGSYTEKCDIWSLGIVFFMLMVRGYPFKLERSPDEPAMSQEALERETAKCPLAFIHPVWSTNPKARALVSDLLAPEEDDRPSAKQAMRGARWLARHRPGSYPCGCSVS